MPPYTLEELKRETIHKLVAETVAHDFLYIIPIEISLKDIIESTKSEVSLKFVEKIGEQEQTHKFTSTGIGPVDALYSGMVGHYGSDYQSLNNIKFDDFQCKVKNSNRNSFDPSEAVRVEMEFSNSSGKRMTFRASSNSFFTATCSTLLGAIQFYINCEKAFSRLRFLHKDAITRGRHDLSQGYSNSISQLVTIASYEHLAHD